MSFSEKLFNPDNLTEGKTRYEEMHPEMKGKKLTSVDGTKVGDTLQTIADKKEVQKEEKEEKDSKKQVALPEETEAMINKGKEELLAFAKKDPSQLATQDHGQEAVRAGELEVLSKWP